MKIAANFSALQQRHALGSSASCSTRSLKSSQESSRLYVEVRRSRGRATPSSSSRPGRRSGPGGWRSAARSWWADGRGRRRVGVTLCGRASRRGRRAGAGRQPGARLRAGRAGAGGRSAIAYSRRARKPSRSRSRQTRGSARRAARGGPAGGRPSVYSPRRASACGAAAASAGSRSAASPAAQARTWRRRRAARSTRLEHARQLHVAVVDLAEQVLELLGALGRRRARTGRSTARPSSRGCSAGAWPRSACRAARVTSARVERGRA